MNFKKHIPNALTCANLLCGLLGIASVFILNDDLTIASYFIYLACIFDFLDGFVARLLNVSSSIGKELDSLADVVTFGVLPGFILATLLGLQFLSSFGNIPAQGFYYIKEPEADNIFMMQYGWKLALLSFLIPLFSALRLAKFNIDERQHDHFIGLPTPANALFISALPFLVNSNLPFAHLITSPIVILVMVPILSYLLIAELPLIALKFKNFGWQDNKMRYILIISALLLIVTLNFMAIPIIIILYIILSIIDNKVVLKTK
ncbi:MAG TPA: CDP-alcohol phosphatidyltransferase family protein [Cytophagaceae bacterium]|jgi:CDP-diacylglycerol--serine O-phosphatidyltransferase|nr:CDP-alcohol phosphatidyltransferase family protein [Cytophagaceae bacterium]